MVWKEERVGRSPNGRYDWKDSRWYSPIIWDIQNVECEICKVQKNNKLLKGLDVRI